MDGDNNEVRCYSCASMQRRKLISLSSLSLLYHISPSQPFSTMYLTFISPNITSNLLLILFTSSALASTPFASLIFAMIILSFLSSHSDTRNLFDSLTWSSLFLASSVSSHSSSTISSCISDFFPPSSSSCFSRLSS
jgi:hypothetical protein